MVASADSEHDPVSEMKAFDETKAGVKGLVDAGITKVPHIFIQPPDSLAQGEDRMDIPVINLGCPNAGPACHKETVQNIGQALGKWGFFQVINHGVHESLLQEETGDRGQERIYTRDLTRRVTYNSNTALYNSVATDWRDSIFCSMSPEPPRPQELPEACREILMGYSKHVMRLGSCLFELLSEALGLHPNHLKEIDCGKGHSIMCHYYPPCPQPELTSGVTKHSDNDFHTILLQDQIGGLQVLHQNQWINVPPIPGALVINIKDLLQRGLSVSVACFFGCTPQPSSRLFGPIKELTSADNPPIYKETTLPNYTACYISKGVYGTSALPDFKL
ncbi:hypothetical protein EUGRSUZ_H03125 [Eucalyptus grandis]|uniref:Uncharacterized protein n=2 Tax=Eucalyptus grandis TaxID=71139 RepID=A0ACC3JTG4_EUCGR|nr:hypothetical protein EUGRSUZ_H03125 [Eucalyptus grandis]